jgi:3-hydroxyacyl-CoA dehydrogenase
MSSTVKKAAVFDSGSMGSRIAARFDNAGVPLLLRDVAGKDGRRNAAAESGVVPQVKAAGSMHTGLIELLEACHVEGDPSPVAEADWTVESVIEDFAATRYLFAQIDTARRTDVAISSNTPTIRWARAKHLLNVAENRAARSSARVRAERCRRLRRGERPRRGLIRRRRSPSAVLSPRTIGVGRCQSPWRPL